MKGKIIGIASFIAVVAIVLVYMFLNRFEYNEPGTIGNTAGNLYNGGLFCEYEGSVYFANPYDDNSLYKMDLDGSNVEKLHGDTVSYINVANDNIYYERFNYESGVEAVFRGSLYGVYRLEDGDSKSNELNTGLVKSLVLCDNTIYYLSYNEDDLFEMRAVDIDGKNDRKIADKAYLLACVSNGNLYFAEVEGNHNLLKLNTETGIISTYKDGNFYMPIVSKEYIYYIDLNNDRKLCRMKMTDDSVEVLSDEKVVNYNLSEKDNVLFYQVENSVEDHRLMKMTLQGENITEIMEGDAFNISITSKYTYFFKKMAGKDVLYRMETNGVSIPEMYVVE